MVMKLNFWSQIQKNCKTELRTLSQGKRFEILKVMDDEIRIKRLETGTEKSIPKEAFEFACRKLRVLHRVELKEIDRE